MDKIEFALPQGVIVENDQKQAMVVVDGKGQKKLKSCKASKVVLWHFPFVRGLQFLFLGLAKYAKMFLEAEVVCGQPAKRKPISKWWAGIAFVVAVLMLVCLLGYLPTQIAFCLVGAKGKSMVRNLLVLAIKLALFFALLAALRVVPCVNECFRFNRAIEKSKYLQMKKKTKRFVCKVDNAPNFLNFVVFVFLLHLVVVTLWGAGYGFWFNFALHIAIFLLCVAVCYEILFYINKVPAFYFVNFLTMWAVVGRPTKTHTETVVVAMTEMDLLQKGREFMEDENKKSFAVVFSEVKGKLADAGITDKSDAEWLIATVLGKNRAEAKLVSQISEKQYQDIIKAAERRANGESLDNIFGFAEFYGLRFDVNKKVLTPRMETELLVEQVLIAEKEYKNCTILDLGTGSGAIAVTIAKNCDAKVMAIDVSKAALATAEANAKKHDAKIDFVCSNLFEDLKRRLKFDIIVSNPPYIPSAEIEKLDKNVKECDPILALDGGEDGLDFYRTIISQAPNRLNKNGQIFFEVGIGQAKAVRKLLKDNGFEETRIIKDYNKIERIVCGKYK